MEIAETPSLLTASTGVRRGISVRRVQMTRLKKLQVIPRIEQADAAEE